MARVKYDSDVMKYMALFENLTGAKLKDCIVSDDGIMFIVEENEIGKAVGRKGSNVHRISSLMKKDIKVIEFNSDMGKFIENLIYPLKLKEFRDEDGVISLYAKDTRERGIIIGRERSRIKSIKGILERHFKVNEIKVL